MVGQQRSHGVPAGVPDLTRGYGVHDIPLHVERCDAAVEGCPLRIPHSRVGRDKRLENGLAARQRLGQAGRCDTRKRAVAFFHHVAHRTLMAVHAKVRDADQESDQRQNRPEQNLGAQVSKHSVDTNPFCAHGGEDGFLTSRYTQLLIDIRKVPLNGPIADSQFVRNLAIAEPFGCHSQYL